MPVVELNYQRLQKLIGGKSNKKKIIDTLPFLGLDIEGQTDNEIRIEYSPNRPDYSTDYGIAIGLQGLLGLKKGVFNLKIKNKGNYQIQVDSSVTGIRPYVTGIVARNGTIDDQSLKQLIVMQEDLHFGIGRKRKKSSIGIHDLGTIAFPLKYTTTNRKHKFIPLNSQRELSIDEILKNSDVGKDYGHILGNSTKVPLIIDSKNKTISVPPIINAAITTVTTKTKDLFVEVTGLNQEDVEDTLSVVATVLQAAGFQLETVKISGAKNSTPKFKLKKLKIDTDLVRKTLGVNLSPSLISSSLKKSRLGATVKGKKIECIIPRYRFDIFGPMDVIEEVLLGYGIEKIQPVLSPSQTLGEKHTTSTYQQSISSIMIGLGFMEAINSSLTSKKILYDKTKRDPSQIISVLDSKSLEHTILRDSLLPGLIESLAKNIHESYPQKLFEIGTIFKKTSSVSEEFHLCAITSHKDANFSEMKSVLQSVIHLLNKKTCETKTTTHSTFEKGHVADIVVDGITIGTIGEISQSTKENFKLREPVVAFEINLSG